MKLTDIINDKDKKLNWFIRNYYFAGTVFIVLLQILLFNSFGWGNTLKLFYSQNAFSKFMIPFYSCFFHADWKHVLLNMLCFFIAGLYIERKTGTIKFLLLIIFLCFFAGMATFVVGGAGRGFSNVNYALYGYIIIDYFSVFIKNFMLVKEDKLNAFDIIFGAVVIGLIILAFFYKGGDTFFASYPHDLMRDVHWPGMVAGTLTDY